MRIFKQLLIALTALFASTAMAQMPQGEYLDGKNAKVAVVLAHGQGLDADSHVVGPLRKAIHSELGYHTLSLQMPTLAGNRSPDTFQQYASTFPDAYTRIQAALDFLKNEKGVERIYLMGYSMGGRMTSAFLANHPDSGVVGYLGVGLLAGGPEPLNTNLNLRKIRMPVLDIYAENDRDAQFAENRKAMVSDRFVQVPIVGAKHDYRGYDQQIAQAVNTWLTKQETK
ncbi:dienelactone hydrolase family protein [Pigmentiphaga litoralis]|uniref:Putative alpha/beta-hydrolase family hydrolase n=1 Tax=Pigmentiphaga litoralis TaxID=516702 RepID=A0A7Y9LKA2_9BURK|nr:alpha/beta fold hydrolase [Pigmentiphaga litoralis]NYE23632.1 putative alpha/beta-hydrolase family hydrolase [Pigmentiphaga litoralis]NYE82754.1 putative alpha/beta-hydrolase family hydrolase [Pigmentiphaga litoralis]